jgi:hypothetical protein
MPCTKEKGPGFPGPAHFVLLKMRDGDTEAHGHLDHHQNDNDDVENINQIVQPITHCISPERVKKRASKLTAKK